MPTADESVALGTMPWAWAPNVPRWRLRHCRLSDPEQGGGWPDPPPLRHPSRMMWWVRSPPALTMHTAPAARCTRINDTGSIISGAGIEYDEFIGELDNWLSNELVESRFADGIQELERFEQVLGSSPSVQGSFIS